MKHSKLIRVVSILILFLFASGCMGGFVRTLYFSGGDDFQWDDLEVEFGFPINSKSSCCLILFDITWFKPEKLWLKVSGVNVPYTHVLINFVEITYEDGNTLYLKEDDGRPLKLPFKDYAYWKNGGPVKSMHINSATYDFEKKIDFREDQQVTVSVSLTLLPDKRSHTFTCSFLSRSETSYVTFSEIMAQ